MKIDTSSIGINSVDSSQLTTTICEEPTYFLKNQTGEEAKPDFKKGVNWRPLQREYSIPKSTLKEFLEGITEFNPQEVTNMWTEYQVKLPGFKKYNSFQKQECRGIYTQDHLEHVVKGLEQSIDLDPFLPLYQKGLKISALSAPAIFETYNLKKEQTKLIASVAYSITEAKTGEETFFRKLYGVTLQEGKKE